MVEMKDMYINSPIFENIWNLRFLKFYNVPNYISKVHCPNRLPEGLRYLYWDGYPAKALPSSFSSEKLVELDLCGSKIERLWDGEMDVPNLRRLDLSGSQHLTRIPKFSNAPCLEYINLQSCKNLLDSDSSFQHLDGLRLLSLCFCEKWMSFPKIAGSIENLYLVGAALEEVPSSIESLTKLSTLDLSNCAMLKYISPNIFKLKSLRSLFFGGCSNLEIFPEISEITESLKELDLSKSNTGIKELPLSIENLNRLSKLQLRSCKSLERLPSSICNLRSLTYLDVADCSKLNKLPDNLGNLTSLIYLFAWGTTICQLPSSLTFLEKLEELDCSRLRGLTLPPMLGSLHSLTQLNLKDCNLIEVPEEIGCLSRLVELDLSGNEFESLPKSIKQLSRLRWLYLNNCEQLESLAELPLGLLHMEAVNCKQLQSLPDASHFAESVTACGTSYGGKLSYMFTYCMGLHQTTLSKLLKESLIIIQCEKEFTEEVQFNISYSGNNIPQWFTLQNFGSSINFNPPLHNWSSRKLRGFALCAILVIEEFCIEPYVSVFYECHIETSTGDTFKFGDSLVVRYDAYWKNQISCIDHVVFGYHACSHQVKFCTGDYTNFSFKFVPNRECKIKYCGLQPIFVEPIISLDRFGANMFPDEEFNATNQDYKETMVEAPTKTKFFPHEAGTSARGSGYRSSEEKMEPHHGKRDGLLLCYCWSFIGALCVFGLLALLMLRLSTLCKIYLSYHAQNM